MRPGVSLVGTQSRCGHGHHSGFLGRAPEYVVRARRVVRESPFTKVRGIASSSSTRLQELPLRNAHNKTHSRLIRCGGTSSYTMASSHRTRRPPSATTLRVKRVSDPPVRPKRESNRNPACQTKSRSSSKLLVAATSTRLPVGNRRRSKHAPVMIQDSGL